MKADIKLLAKQEGVDGVAQNAPHELGAMDPAIYGVSAGPAPLVATETLHLRASFVLLDQCAALVALLEAIPLRVLALLSALVLLAAHLPMCFVLAVEATLLLALGTVDVGLV